jgi:hypothetical protein
MRSLSRLSDTAEEFERGTCGLGAASLHLPILGAALLTLRLAGCATSEKVQVKQVGDSDLSRREIGAENRRLDEPARRAEEVIRCGIACEGLREQITAETRIRRSKQLTTVGFSEGGQLLGSVPNGY